MFQKACLVLVLSPGVLVACASDETKPCYGPEANVSSAFAPGAVGCACDPSVDQPVCVNGGGAVGYVAFMCSGGHWQSAYDGPCMNRKLDAGAGAGASLDGPATADIASIDAAPADTPQDPRCIVLSDIPTVQVMAEGSSFSYLPVLVLSGPCTALTAGFVEFHYWSTGDSCPRMGDQVTCQVQVTSPAGSVAVVPVTFVAEPLDSTMLHWEPRPSTVWVSFPGADGGAEAGALHAVDGGTEAGSQPGVDGATEAPPSLPI
jgi:hypothetical protein